ncbi:MAG TPA: hypothetical protein VFQ03_03415 [Candidatus Binatia bacterium]|nr:hypothetical protein [Candidatus Binatia bacterium]
MAKISLRVNGKNQAWIGRVTPSLKFSEIPEVDIVLINRQDVASLGAGELATVPVPAAIASAIFDAVGVKMREVPFTPKRLLAAMQKA